MFIVKMLRRKSYFCVILVQLCGDCWDGCKNKCTTGSLHRFCSCIWIDDYQSDVCAECVYVLYDVWCIYCINMRSRSIILQTVRFSLYNFEDGWSGGRNGGRNGDWSSDLNDGCVSGDCVNGSYVGGGYVIDDCTIGSRIVNIGLQRLLDVNNSSIRLL